MDFDWKKLNSVFQFFKDITDHTNEKFENFEKCLPYKFVFKPDEWSEFESYTQYYETSKINEKRYNKLNDML